MDRRSRVFRHVAMGGRRQSLSAAPKRDSPFNRNARSRPGFDPADRVLGLQRALTERVACLSLRRLNVANSDEIACRARPHRNKKNLASAYQTVDYYSHSPLRSWQREVFSNGVARGFARLAYQQAEYFFACQVTMTSIAMTSISTEIGRKLYKNDRGRSVLIEISCVSYHMHGIRR